MASDQCPTCVLVVEDDDRIRESVGALLERRGYSAVLAADSEQAFEQLLNIARPCLVLVDLLTPGMDGERLLAALEGSDRIATLPVVLVSVPAPGLLTRPAVVKRPIDLEILYRIVRDHCCGDPSGGPHPKRVSDPLPSGDA
jgi:CheY-like chemotaxis protein